MSSGYEDGNTNSRENHSLDEQHASQCNNHDEEKDSNCASDDKSDVLSSSEEPNARRRLSSLDIYLLTPKEEPESYVLKAKETLLEVFEEVEEFNRQEANKLSEEERRQLASNQKRAEIIMARLQKNDYKRRESTLQELSHLRMEKARSPSLSSKPRVLTTEKRALLKKLLLKKAEEEVRNEQQEMMKEREEHLNRVCPPLDMDGMNDAQLVDLVKELHKRALRCEAEKMELEERLQMQTEEILELLQEIQQKQGRFSIPVLRKVKRN